MDGVSSKQLGHSYFASPDYMIVQTWISLMLLLLDHVTLTRLGTYRSIKLYPRVIGYTLEGGLCHHVKTMLHYCIFYNIIIIVYPAL